MSCGTLHVMYVWVDMHESFLIQSEQLFWPTKCLKAAHDFPKICTPLVWESRRWQIPRCRGSKRVGISTLAAQTALGHHILMVSYHVHDCHGIAKWKFHWKRDTSAWLIPLFTANFRKSPAPIFHRWCCNPRCHQPLLVYYWEHPKTGWCLLYLIMTGWFINVHYILVYRAAPIIINYPNQHPNHSCPSLNSTIPQK
jgi:hypothetical protein